MEEDHSSKKIWFIVGGIVILLIAAATVYVLFSKQGSDGTGTTKGVGSLFGFIGTDVGRPVTGDIRPGSLVPDGTVTSGAPDEALFRQLSTIQIAGATAVVRDGKTLVRYVSRENGFIYEADPVTGTSRQLTNTTVPRIYEAFWGNNGQTVVLRFLQKDPLTNRDVIKTQIGDLALPISTTTAVLGSLEGLRDRLPDNISQVSISRKGAYLFYLLPVTDGVSGTIVTLANRIPKEVLRLSFSEWLPSMLDDGNVILTTKPSAEVPGFAY